MEIMEPERQLELLRRGTVEIISEEELLERLRLSYRERRPLRIKAGFDPTAPDLHLGHCVLLRKLRQFQDLGHTVVFIVGDFTALIGDPTGRSEARPRLSREQVAENAATYERQVYRVLRPDRTELVFNSRWLEPMSALDLLELAELENVARLLERDDFEKRYREGRPITLREFFYPLIQAYDSVQVKADVEVGGSDQKFNILLGRHLQRHFGLTPQVVVLLPLLEGLDGKRKMSKSYGNYVGLDEPPEEMFGKLMSVPDETMWHYYELLSSRTAEEIERLRRSCHPMEAKKALAREIVAWLLDAESAERAQRDFETKFSRRAFPEDAPVAELERTEGMSVLDLVTAVSSRIRNRSEAKRLIRQGGLTIDGTRYTDPTASVPEGEELRVKIGKREFVRVRFT